MDTTALLTQVSARQDFTAATANLSTPFVSWGCMERISVCLGFPVTSLGISTRPSLGFPAPTPTCALPLRMASPYIGSAVLCQLNAMLQLIATLSPSLTPNEIMEIRRGLAHAYNSIGIVLEDRNLQAEGATPICEFGTKFLDSVLTLFQ